MAMPVVPPPKDVAGHMLGPVLVGTLLNHLLTGIVIGQLYTYLRNYQSDQIVLKLLVLFCVALNITTLFLDAMSTYEYAVIDFGDVAQLFHPNPPLHASFVVMAFPSTCIQCFYGWRVTRLTGRQWFLLFVVLMAAVQWGDSKIGLSLMSMIMGTKMQGHGKAKMLEPYLISWWSIATSVDLLISINLVWWFQTRRTGFRDTNDLLDRLTRLTIRSCGAVTIWSIATILTYALLNSGTCMVFALSLPPFYLITLLSSLNSRYYGPQSGHIYWSDETPNLSSTANHGTSSRRVQSAIHITRTVEADAYEFDVHPSTRSRATEISLKTNAINMDAQSVRDFETKADLELNPDSSTDPRIDVYEHRGDGQ